MTDIQIKQILAKLGLRLPDIAPGEVIDIAVDYVRVSSPGQLGRDGDEDGDGYSIPAQVQQCEREAVSLGVPLAKTYVERAESAKSDDRPVLQRMLTELPLIQALPMVNLKYLIIPKVDRLARNRLDDALLCQKLIGWGITLVSATENIDETPSGQLMHGMLAVFSEYYSNNLANEVMKGLRRKHETGGTPHKPPIGYKSKRELIGSKDIRSVILDEERSSLVQLAFTLYATGEWSLHKLADHLENEGLRSRGTPKYPERPLTASRIHAMLHNPYYMGVVVWNGQRYPGKHEPLVDQDTFDHVQALLAAARIGGERPQKHEHYLRGSIFCEECLGRLLYGRHRSRSGNHYEYFCCNNRTVRRRGQCSSGHYSVPVTEDNIIEVVYPTVLIPAEVQEQIRAELHRELSERTSIIESEAKRHERTIKQIEAKQQKLIQLFYNDRISEDVFDTEQDKLKTERRAANQLRATATAQLDDVQAALDLALSRVEHPYEVYRDGTPLERRLMNRAIFERIEVGPDAEITGTTLTPIYQALSAWQPGLGQPKTCQTKTQDGPRLAGVRPLFAPVHFRLICRDFPKATGNLSLGLVVARQHIGHSRGELVDVPVGVDVAGRLDRGVAEQLLDGLQVSRGVEDALAGGVPRLVHPLAAGGALWDDSRVCEPPVPPRVHPVDAHWLRRVAGHLRSVALHPGHQVMVGLRFDFEDMPFEIQPERGVGDGQLADLLALREDRQPSALVVEVLELDGLERALAQVVVEQ
jgi:site-specific DNA recombinase